MPASTKSDKAKRKENDKEAQQPAALAADKKKHRCECASSFSSLFLVSFSLFPRAFSCPMHFPPVEYATRLLVFDWSTDGAVAEWSGASALSRNVAGSNPGGVGPRVGLATADRGARHRIVRVGQPEKSYPAI